MSLARGATFPIAAAARDRKPVATAAYRPEPRGRGPRPTPSPAPRAETDGDSIVSLRLHAIAFVDESNRQDWDGVHVLTRVQSEAEF